MKMFFAMLSNETNTFSPMPTGQADFKVTRGIDLLNTPSQALGPLVLLKEAAQQHGWPVAMSLMAEATPSGKVVCLEKRQHIPIDPRRVKLDSLGLNHLSWHRGFSVNGHDLRPLVLERFLARLQADPNPEWDPHTIESLGMIPND